MADQQEIVGRFIAPTFIDDKFEYTYTHDTYVAHYFDLSK